MKAEKSQPWLKIALDGTLGFTLIMMKITCYEGLLGNRCVVKSKLPDLPFQENENGLRNAI